MATKLEGGPGGKALVPMATKATGSPKKSLYFKNFNLHRWKHFIKTNSIQNFYMKGKEFYLKMPAMPVLIQIFVYS